MAAKDVDRLQSGLNGRVWVEYVENVAIIKLGCEENRLNKAFMDQLNRCLDEILQNSDVQAVITVGIGKFYSNGLDLIWLKELAMVSRDDLASFIKTWHRTLKRLLLFPLPTIAAINGHAFAGGSFLSLCHDYRIMQTGRGWWSINEVHLGMQIPKWLIKLASTKIPGSKAQVDAIVFGKRLVAEEALDLGIIHGTASADNLLQEALKLVKESYRGSVTLERQSVQMMKEDTYRDILQLFDDGLHFTHKDLNSKV